MASNGANGHARRIFPAPTVKVYVACSFGRRDLARQVAEVLTGEGFLVTSRWHSVEAEHWNKDPKIAADHDLTDLDAADGLLSLTEGPEAGYQTGGRHVEFGYAIARMKWLWIVGPLENVFHEGIGRVARFDTLSAWLRHMTGRIPAELPAAVAR